MAKRNPQGSEDSALRYRSCIKAPPSRGYFGPRNTLDSRKKSAMLGAFFCAAGPMVFVEAECFEAEAQRAFVVIVSYGTVSRLALGTNYNCCDTAAAPVPCPVAFVVAGGFVVGDDEEAGVLKEFASE